ncbi:MAG: hypothetical protein OEW49_06540 [Nitrosopumilus sp.]|nr:hypothetical protein [Nitrosopumilus sp.]
MSKFERQEEKEPVILSAKEYNRYHILKIITKHGPQRFKDLEEKTQRSPRGLNNMLKDLLEEKRIQKIIHKDHQAYALTDAGTNAFKHLDLMLRYRRNLIIGGSYFEGYSNLWEFVISCNLPWGIETELILDKNISEELNPITIDTADKVQKFLFNRILSDVKDKKIKLDHAKNGTILLEFSITYKELVKSIEGNSLKISENITQEELDLYQKIDDMSLQKWESDLLKEVREEKITKEQFKRKLKRLQKQHEKNEAMK